MTVLVRARSRGRMIPPRARRGVVRWAVATALSGAIALAVLSAAVASAQARSSWGASFAIASAPSLDAATPVLAIAPGGAAAIGVGTSNGDVAGAQHAQLALRSAQGRLGAVRTLTGAAQILAMAWSGRQLVILEGRTTASQNCCSSVDTVTVSSAGRIGTPHRLVAGLAGTTTANLLTLANGRLTAVVATNRGVWTAQTGAGGRFGSARQIAPRHQQPEAMAAAWLGAEQTAVAWSAASGTLTTADPGTIDVAAGSAAGAPAHPAQAVALAAGHRVDELAIAGRGKARTLAWIESWYGARGAYQSRVEVANLGAGKVHPRTLSPAGRLASGLSLVADPAGDETIVWSQCVVSGACAVQAAGRPAGGSFGAVRTLGTDDGSSPPSLAISPTGQVLVGWVRSGQPVASVGFGTPTVLSSAAGAGAIDVAYGAHGALAAWSQGTASGSVRGAAYRSG